MEKYLSNFKNCIQKEAPFCKDTCPFNYDIFAFLDKVKIGNFNAAYKTYKTGVGFPAIASYLCTENCKDKCPLKHTINLKKIEQAVVEFATRKTPTDYNLPLKKQRIAIIGGGISGLGCLLRLATNKYHVDLYEKSSILGGSIKNICDPGLIDEDIELQLMYEEYNVFLNREITSLNELEGYDAIYIATGSNGATFDFSPCLHEEDTSLSRFTTHASKTRFFHDDVGIFFGGEILGVSTINALSMGLSSAVSIDNFLRTGNINYGDGQKKSNILIDEKIIHDKPEVTPSIPFTKETAIEEASRCIQCQCNPCQVYCDLTTFYKKWPLRIRDEIQVTILPGTSEVKATPAKRLINTCTQCGLCKDTCPKDIDLGGLILEARKSMHKQDKIPWVFNEFWLNDMDFSNNVASLTKAPSDTKNLDYIFFPGCQLSASEPALVSKTYEYLLTKYSTMGIYLSCCGLPASWAGQDELRDETLNTINSTWEDFGEPTFVLACPSCHKFFSEFLPHIKLTYLYDFIEPSDFYDENSSHGKLRMNPTVLENTYSIFDPCTTRVNDSIRKSIRNILNSVNLKLEQNLYHEKFTSCCGYGGQSHVADPQFIEHIKNRRLAESSLPYITYCINCRDSFKKDNLGTLHILDLLFNNEPTNPTITERRQNRLNLKKELLKKYWSEDMEIKKHPLLDKIIISNELKESLSENRILEDEVATVIEFCEKTKRVIFDEESNSFSGYRKIGKATYWVEYTKENDSFILIDCYTHRISIDLEEVWNGEKRINEEML